MLTGPESVEKQIGDQVYESCVSMVSSINPIARRWPQASKSEVIVCQASENDQTANDVMQYAQFESAAALSAALRTASPDGTYCSIGSAVVTEDIFLDDLRDAFRAMCANRGGTLHTRVPPGEAAGRGLDQDRDSMLAVQCEALAEVRNRVPHATLPRTTSSQEPNTPTRTRQLGPRDSLSRNGWFLSSQRRNPARWLIGCGIRPETLREKAR